jgi:FtsP/CotA-like multicopper oxidase with cupredoxin domain
MKDEPARETTLVPLEDPTDQRTRVSTAIEQPTRGEGEVEHVVRSYSAALLMAGAAAIHFAVAPMHLNEYLAWGIFFVCVGIAQFGLAVALLLAPGRQVYAGALAGTLIVIGIWLLSRTAGVPIAPVPWRPEPVGFPDVTATLLESVTCLLLILLIWRPHRARPRGRVRVALKTIPALLLAPLAAFLGVGAALAPMEAAYSVAPAIPGRASTSVTDLIAPAGQEPVRSYTLTAAVTTIAGNQAWAFNGTVPGPELRVTQGDRVRVTLVNHLPAATSIHWHGIRVPGAEDGVAGVTQDAVPPGGSFVYEFIANDAGTFWYHSHQETNAQVPRGLIGSIVVKPRGPNVQGKRDYTLMIHSLPGTDSVAVNGASSLRLEAVPGDMVRLRLINGATPGSDSAPQMPVLVGAPYTLTGLDGHDLNAPQELGPERIPLGMGQRADLVFKMPAGGAVRLVGIKGAAPFLPFGSRQSTATVTIGEGPVPAAIDPGSVPLFDLTGYGLTASDPLATASYDLTRQIVLDGAPTFRNGAFDFASTIDGRASPYVPPIRVREGELVRLHVANAGDGNHPIHIHGHVLSVLSKNGRPVSGSPVHLDTIHVGPHETWDVAFKADNPGVWMLHCHVLDHAAAGMSMTINYDGISTPFTMGSRSGNVPE